MLKKKLKKQKKKKGKGRERERSFYPFIPPATTLFFSFRVKCGKGVRVLSRNQLTWNSVLTIPLEVCSVRSSGATALASSPWAGQLCFFSRSARRVFLGILCPDLASRTPHSQHPPLITGFSVSADCSRFPNCCVAGHQGSGLALLPFPFASLPQ